MRLKNSTTCPVARRQIARCRGSRGHVTLCSSGIKGTLKARKPSDPGGKTNPVFVSWNRLHIITEETKTQI